MIRVAAPGLPSRPKLWFDPDKRRAKVFAWHPTWKSHEWAIRCTEVVVWIANGLLAWFIWWLIPLFEIVPRVMLFLFAVAVAATAITYLLRMSLQPFLARQIFATRTVLWFTPEAIGFRSRLYSNPVVVWRKWNAKPVRTRFILQNDENASAYSNSLSSKRKAPKDHLQEAMVLAITLTTVHRESDIGFEHQGVILRSIPVTEVNSQLAPRFTMVYAAAATLTSPIQKPVSNRSSDGIDIDAA